MKSQIKLGRVLGIEIGLHYSWFIIAFLISSSLAVHFRQTNPHWGNSTIWILSISTSLLFFAAIVAHELSHALVARMRNLSVKSITLFALGGVAQIEKEAADAKSEFWIGIAGPIASVLIGSLLLSIAWSLGWRMPDTPPTPLLAMCVWLGYINFSLALFNMIPGFPLDGGRVLRAALWWRLKDMERATRISARIGQAVAFLFIMAGIYNFFGGRGFGGLWIAFIGWFLLNAASSSYAQTHLSQVMQRVRVEDVMSHDCPIVKGNMDLDTFVNDYLLRTGRRCFLVSENDQITGLITSHEVKKINRDRWPYTSVREAMRTLSNSQTVTPETSLAAALEALTRLDVNQLPVISGNRVEGILSRAHLMQFLKTQSEFKM
jgi:Zn-dependent protease/CBS domain-containing protein